MKDVEIATIDWCFEPKSANNSFYVTYYLDIEQTQDEEKGFQRTCKNAAAISKQFIPELPCLRI